MYFWSQDASTKEAVLTGFYGYRLSLQRSMTETKLLGQQTYVSPPNSTNQEYRRDIQARYDDLRKALMHEPRGHADMYGCLLLPPNDEGADFGILFLRLGSGSFAFGFFAFGVICFVRCIRFIRCIGCIRFVCFTVAFADLFFTCQDPFS